MAESIAQTKNQIKAKMYSAHNRTNPEVGGILDAHLMILDDETLLLPTQQAIFEGRINCARAWQSSIEKVAAGFYKLEDPYLRARGNDVEDVGRQVLINLLGHLAGKLVVERPSILIATDLAPSETALLDPTVILGICTAGGGSTSHTAILARNLGIPAVSGVVQGS